MTSGTRFVRNVHEETFSKDILRSFGSVTIADGRGGTFETDVSLLAALSPGLRPILSEVLQTNQDGMLLIVPESSKDTLNHLDNIFHCGETKVSCTDVQQFAQEMMDLKEDLRCLGLNVPENFWTLQTIERPRFSKDETSELTKIEMPELLTSEMEHFADLPVENSVNDEQEDNVEREKKDEEIQKKSLEDAIWVKYSEEIEKPAYFCLICKIFYLNTKFLKKHLELRHPDLKVNFKGLYDCQNCSKSLRGQMMFFRHIADEVCKVGNVVCDICGVSLPKNYVAEHKRMKHVFDEKECKYCGKLFQNQACLEKHSKAQHGDPIPCQFCGKQFKTTTELKKHIGNKHTADEDKPFMCELCGKRYGVKKNVKLHHLAAHNGGRKDFHCNFCEYKTWSKPNRDKHEKAVHKGIK